MATKTYYTEAGLDKADANEIVERIKRGEVFIYPTDTVYGLGCDIMNESAVKRLFKIKGRSMDKALSVAFSDVAQIEQFAEVSPADVKVLEERLPGPYTFIVSRGGMPTWVTGGLDTAGVRVPDNTMMSKVIKKSGPVITTSANLSGRPAIKDLNELSKELRGAVDFIIDSGVIGSGMPSTLVDLRTGKETKRG